METYRLKSKLVENDREFVIQTINDANLGAISSMVYVDHEETENISCPLPMGIDAEEVLSLVKLTHEEKKKELETLLETYHKVIAGGNAEIMYHLGTAFFHKRFYREAKELFQTAVTLNPELHQAYSYQGMTQLALNLPDKAIESCTVAVQKRPGYADYHNSLGEALLANHSSQQAIREFEEAIRINLYYSDAYLNLGLALVLNALDKGDKAAMTRVSKQATDYFKKASLTYPDYDTAIFDEGLEALRNANLKHAFSLFQNARETKKEKHRQEFASFYLKFAIHPDLMSEQVVNDRIRFLEGEIEKNPTYVDLRAELGRCLLERAKFSWQRGVEQYRKTVEINPSLSRVHYCFDEAEKEYENICAVLSKVVEKS